MGLTGNKRAKECLNNAQIFSAVMLATALHHNKVSAKYDLFSDSACITHYQRLNVLIIPNV